MPPRTEYTIISSVDDPSPRPICLVDCPGFIEPDSDDLRFAPAHDLSASPTDPADLDMSRGDGTHDLFGEKYSHTFQSGGNNAAKSTLPSISFASKELKSFDAARRTPFPNNLDPPRAQTLSDTSEYRSRASRRASDVEAALQARSAGACALSSSRKPRCDHPLGHFGKDRKRPEYCGRCSNHDRSRQHYWSLLRARAVGGLSIVGAGLATVAIVNFDQGSGTCPSLESDHRWLASPSLLRDLPTTLRCPGFPIYMVAISVYSVAGIFQVAQEPRYWADCALVAVLVAVVTGALHGIRPMLDALVLGGFLSLVCCKGIAWFASAYMRD